MGEAKDDIHVCILCMRAIMNNKVKRSIPWTLLFFILPFIDSSSPTYLTLLQKRIIHIVLFPVRFQHGYSTQGGDKLYRSQSHTQKFEVNAKKKLYNTP